MLDEKDTDKLLGAVVGALASNEEGDESISAKEFFTAGLAAGLDMSAADIERRAPTLKAITASYKGLSAEENTEYSSN